MDTIMQTDRLQARSISRCRCYTPMFSGRMYIDKVHCSEIKG